MGSVSTEIPGLKLIVRKSDGCARYVILQSAGYAVRVPRSCCHQAPNLT